MEVSLKDLKVGDVLLCSRTANATLDSFFISKITSLSGSSTPTYVEVVDLASKHSLRIMSDATTVEPSKFFIYGKPYRLNTVFIKGFIGTGKKSIRRFNIILKRLRNAEKLLNSYNSLLENIGDIENV